MEYYKGLIALRRQLPGLGDKSEKAAQRIFEKKSADGVVSYLMDNRDQDSDTRWQTLMVVYNSTGKPEKVSLPGEGWELLCDAYNSMLWKASVPVAGIICAEPQSVTVLGCVRDALGENEFGRRKAV